MGLPIVLARYAKDYKEMTDQMIYGDTPSFDALLESLDVIMKRL